MRVRAARCILNTERDAVHRIRVLVGRLPRMLHEIVNEMLEAQSDLELVPPPTSAGGLWDMVLLTRPDVLVLGEGERGLQPPLRSVLERHPRLSIVVLTEDARRGTVHRFRLDRQELEDVSPQSLLAAIRAGETASN